MPSASSCASRARRESPAATRTTTPTRGAELFAADWAVKPDVVAALQRAVVLQWYRGDVEADCAAMIAVLEQDLARMSAGRALEQSSWELAMRRLLGGPERRAIRGTHLERPLG